MTKIVLVKRQTRAFWPGWPRTKISLRIARPFCKRSKANKTCPTSRRCPVNVGAETTGEQTLYEVNFSQSRIDDVQFKTRIWGIKFHNEIKRFCNLFFPTEKAIWWYCMVQSVFGTAFLEILALSLIHKPESVTKVMLLHNSKLRIWYQNE